MEGFMRKVWLLLLALSLSACATVRKAELVPCGNAESYERGLTDALQGIPASTAFTQLCTSETIAVSVKKYKEGFAHGRANRKARAAATSEANVSRALQTLPSSPAWICEVEASAKVFTGVGGSLEEATRSAKDTCGAHFQSSSCQQTECKQNL